MTQSLKKNALVGVVWGAIGSIVGKSAGFIAQIVLGWLLSKEDFALYAIAVSFASFTACLNNGGSHRILIQKAKEYENYAWLIFIISLIFNFFILGIMLAGARVVSEIYQAPDLNMMFALMGGATVLATPSYIFHARMLGELRFKVMQILAICSHIIRHGSTIVLAYMGFGALSFVLPLVLNALTDNIFAWIAVKELPPKRKMSWKAIKAILHNSKWVIFGSFSMALVQNGDNLAISLTADKVTLAEYFFAFQLTFSLASLLGGSLQSVLMPTFSNVADDLDRQRAAFLRSVNAMAVVVSLVSLTLVPLAQPLISFIWAGKWDEAIPVVQLLSLSLPFVILSSIARAAIESKGKWKLVSILSLCEGVGTVSAALIGGMMGGLVEIASAVAILKIFAGLFQLIVAIRVLSGKISIMIRPVIGAYISVIFALIPFLAISYFNIDIVQYYKINTLNIPANYINTIYVLLSYTLISMFFLPKFCKKGWNEVVSIVNLKRQKI